MAYQNGYYPQYAPPSQQYGAGSQQPPAPAISNGAYYWLAAAPPQAHAAPAPATFAPVVDDYAQAGARSDVAPAAPQQQSQPEPIASQASVDFPLLLIGLAEEYFDAAYNQPSSGRLSHGRVSRGTFCQLIATGLACLEVVLKVCCRSAVAST